mmetsp:Transcript_21761/g.68166  ORF Transcript_21761/g.68166 Transcript_21761/m.68166 type:complete len:528 (+) Transcript_21761:810-2393(+)
MRSISSWERPPELRMTTDCCLLVALSLAETLRMPSASRSKETSIWGVPRGAGGMPTRSNWPRSLLSAASSRSPWRTLIWTWGWLSAAVEKTWAFLVGMVVLRLMRRGNMPPSVSMPRLSGVTSRRRMSLMSPRRTPPWMAAPMATTSSGLTPLWGFLPKNCSTRSWTLGMRVMPPTRMTSSMEALSMPASATHFAQGSRVRSTRLSTMVSNWAFVTLTFMCLGPEASAVMKGSETSVAARPSSSRFAFSAASRSRCIASRSAERSIPESLRNSARRCLRSASSKSSPPSMVSPFVDLTSKTPPEISRIETSKVPPPRSKTATSLPSSFLSMPYARAAAVGSLMMRRTSSPAIFPASFVACRCESLKYAGTVTIALLTLRPRKPSAVSFILLSTMEPTWLGLSFVPSLISTQASADESALTILYGTSPFTATTSASSNLRPISRFVAYSVLSGFVTAWRLACCPTSRDPSSLNATMLGVVLAPSAFSITRAFLPSMIATQLFVVPRSIPTTSPASAVDRPRPHRCTTP